MINPGPLKGLASLPFRLHDSRLAPNAAYNQQAETNALHMRRSKSDTSLGRNRLGCSPSEPHGKDSERSKAQKALSAYNSNVELDSRAASGSPASTFFTEASHSVGEDEVRIISAITRTGPCSPHESTSTLPAFGSQTLLPLPLPVVPFESHHFGQQPDCSKSRANRIIHPATDISQTFTTVQYRTACGKIYLIFPDQSRVVNALIARSPWPEKFYAKLRSTLADLLQFYLSDILRLTDEYATLHFRRSLAGKEESKYLGIHTSVLFPLICFGHIGRDLSPRHGNALLDSDSKASSSITTCSPHSQQRSNRRTISGRITKQDATSHLSKAHSDSQRKNKFTGDGLTPTPKTKQKKPRPPGVRAFHCPVRQASPDKTGFPIEILPESCFHPTRYSASDVKEHIGKAHQAHVSVEQQAEVKSWGRKAKGGSDHEIVVKIYCVLYDLHGPDLPEIYMTEGEMSRVPSSSENPQLWQLSDSDRSWLDEHTSLGFGDPIYLEHLAQAQEFDQFQSRLNIRDSDGPVRQFLMRRMGQLEGSENVTLYLQMWERIRQFDQIRARWPAQSTRLLFLWSCVPAESRRHSSPQVLTSVSMMRDDNDNPSNASTALTSFSTEDGSVPSTQMTTAGTANPATASQPSPMRDRMMVDDMPLADGSVGSYSDDTIRATSGRQSNESSVGQQFNTQTDDSIFDKESFMNHIDHLDDLSPMQLDAMPEQRIEHHQQQQQQPPMMWPQHYMDLHFQVANQPALLPDQEDGNHEVVPQHYDNFDDFVLYPDDD